MNHKRSNPPPSSGGGSTNLASCVVATIFLLFVGIVILILFFTLFKPRDPRISVTSFQLPSYAISNGTVNFTFSQFVSVQNPNREVFSHYDSSLQLTSAGSPVGFMFIPAGKIDGGHTQYMSATFTVESFRVAADLVPSAAAGGEVVPAASMEIDSMMRMEGRVRIAHFLTHQVESIVACRVIITVADGSVLGFRC